MFTGIVREVGRVVSIGGEGPSRRLELDAPATAPSVDVGDSISVGGVCLTAVAVAGGRVSFDVVPETLSHTALGRLGEGSRVNLEPALRVGEPLGGHYVQGHVELVGSVRSVTADEDGTRVSIDAPPDLLRYVVEKGSITVDGTSLTVAAVDATGFSVALVPHTLAATTLGELASGDPVNLEPDVLAKYVERLLARP